MTTEAQKWENRYVREKNARIQAEKLLEQKSSQLFDANEQLEQQVQLKSSKLRAEEKKFTALFHSSIDGIILYTQEGIILDANSTICQLLKLKPGQLIGTNIIDLYPKEFLNQAIKVKDEVNQHGHTRFEVTLRCADHTYLPTEISASKFEVDEQTIIQGIIRDITERKKIALDMERASESAIKANEAKSLFLATMSHEIRTPLNGILGFSDILIQSDASDEQRQYLQLIKKSGDILLSIINDILDFSRVESQKIELEMVDFNLSECIKETLDIHAQSAATKNVDLLYSIDEDVPLDLNGDIGRIKQIILNLVSNGLKFTNEGYVVVHASRPNTNSIELTITDTGIGFSPELTEQLFQPFIQADASTTRKYGGTGLGLSICKQLIEAMGGSIHASSTPGEGATFVVRLPYLPALQPVPRIAAHKGTPKLDGTRVLAADDHPINLAFIQAKLNNWDSKISQVLPPTLNLSQPVSSPEKPHQYGSTTYALIVEDNPINAKLAKLLIERIGLKAHIAHNGKEAIAALVAKQMYSVIFMDMQMPVMDGLVTSTKIREGEAGHYYTDTPIIAMTANALAEDKRRCLDAGMNHYLAKPINTKELTRILCKLGIIS